MKKTAWLIVCWWMWQLSGAVAQSSELAPNYWKERLFYIPYQVQQRSKLLDPIAKVQLLSSRTGVNDWQTLEEAKPNVQGFSYHAPEDGEYWFSLRHLDRRGFAWPNADVQPQLRVIIDSVQPELTLAGTPDLTGEIVIRYQAQDTNLQPETLVVEVSDQKGDWVPLTLGAPDVSQSNRLVGRARWRPPTGAQSVEVRATIADRAGHQTRSEASIPIRNHFSNQGPALGRPPAEFADVPSSSPAASQLPANVISNPFVSTSRLASQHWPDDNRLPTQSSPAGLGNWQAPPPANPYSVADRDLPIRTPATLVGDGARSRVDSPRTQSLQITPLDAGDVPPLVGDNTKPAFNGLGPRDQSDWMPPARQSDINNQMRAVNSQTFDIEYDLQSVGPWGVAKVELWGTADEGRTWQSFGVDPDNRSPMRVTVPGAGTFGFRIVVDGANSAGAAIPQPGAEPELFVEVDLKPPAVELIAAELGQGNLADHLRVRWTATDSNLEQRPIALFYSSYPNGPWSTIASGLENSGSYTWRIERHVPGRFYLRLEARDRAGNLATYQTASPVELARPQPTGRLRGVRAITDRAARP